MTRIRIQAQAGLLVVLPVPLIVNVVVTESQSVKIEIAEIVMVMPWCDGDSPLWTLAAAPREVESRELFDRRRLTWRTWEAVDEREPRG
jgi:hypothetical protein